MTGGPRLVVADANVYVDAVVHDSTKVLGDPPALSRIPSLPPRTVHPALHLLGVVRDGSDNGDGPGLVISDHILLMTIHALRRHHWPDPALRAYAYAIRALAERSPGGYYRNVPRTQHDCPDPPTSSSPTTPTCFNSAGSTAGKADPSSTPTASPHSPTEQPDTATPEVSTQNTGLQDEVFRRGDRSDGRVTTELGSYRGPLHSACHALDRVAGCMCPRKCSG